MKLYNNLKYIITKIKWYIFLNHDAFFHRKFYPQYLNFILICKYRVQQSYTYTEQNKTLQRICVCSSSPINHSNLVSFECQCSPLRKLNGVQ